MTDWYEETCWAMVTPGGKARVERCGVAEFWWSARIKPGRDGLLIEATDDRTGSATTLAEAQAQAEQALAEMGAA